MGFNQFLCFISLHPRKRTCNNEGLSLEFRTSRLRLDLLRIQSIRDHTLYD